MEREVTIYHLARTSPHSSRLVEMNYSSVRAVVSIVRLMV